MVNEQYEKDIKAAQQFAHKFWSPEDWEQALHVAGGRCDALGWCIKLKKNAQEPTSFPIALELCVLEPSGRLESITSIPIERYEYRDEGIEGNVMVVALLKTLEEGIKKTFGDESLKVFTSENKARAFYASPEGKSVMEQKMLSRVLESAQSAPRMRL